MATSLVIRHKTVPTYAVFHHGIYQSSEICTNLWNFTEKFWNFNPKKYRTCHHLIIFVMRSLSNVLSVGVLVVCITYTINFSSYKVINELRRDVYSGFSNLYFHKVIVLIRILNVYKKMKRWKRKVNSPWGIFSPLILSTFWCYPLISVVNFVL